jgi:hypothetical protein
MKKFVVLLVVVALTCFGSMAFAADISVSGSLDVRSRDFTDLDMNKDINDSSARDTQERVRLNVDAKAGDVKGRISIENDWDTWSRFETPMANGQVIAPATAPSGNAGFLDLREAWINFNIPGIPVNVNVGHQLLQLGDGWFFRSMKYGSDAWVVANVTGNNTAALVDVKFGEGDAAASDDTDAYVLLDVLKIDDNNTVGINLTDLKDRSAKADPLGGNVDLQNIGLHYGGKLGPVALKAEVDLQMGKVTNNDGSPDNKFKGNEIVIQGNVPLDPVTINFTLARGSGDSVTSTSEDIKTFVNALDADQHYTFLYEYKIGGPSGTHTGFSNTTALSVGASFAASKSLNVGADFWWLQATEDVADTQNPGETTKDLGTEIDAHLNWAMYDNLSWNWQVGYFMPGDGMGKDTATGIQGVLSFKF